MTSEFIENLGHAYIDLNTKESQWAKRSDQKNFSPTLLLCHSLFHSKVELTLVVFFKEIFVELTSLWNKSSLFLPLRQIARSNLANILVLNNMQKRIYLQSVERNALLYRNRREHIFHCKKEIHWKNIKTELKQVGAELGQSQSSWS